MTSPPAFAWDDWYATVGGRSIRIPEVTDLLQEIFDHQYPRFDGDVAAERRAFASPTEAARHLKEKALEFGADIVGICEIEPSDIYRGRVITEKYAIAVGQSAGLCLQPQGVGARFRGRADTVVPHRDHAVVAPGGGSADADRRQVYPRIRRKCQGLVNTNRCCQGRSS